MLVILSKAKNLNGKKNATEHQMLRSAQHDSKKVS